MATKQLVSAIGYLRMTRNPQMKAILMGSEVFIKKCRSGHDIVLSRDDENHVSGRVGSTQIDKLPPEEGKIDVACEACVVGVREAIKQAGWTPE